MVQQDRWKATGQGGPASGSGRRSTPEWSCRSDGKPSGQGGPASGSGRRSTPEHPFWQLYLLNPTLSEDPLTPEPVPRATLSDGKPSGQGVLRTSLPKTLNLKP